MLRPKLNDSTRRVSWASAGKFKKIDLGWREAVDLMIEIQNNPEKYEKGPPGKAFVQKGKDPVDKADIYTGARIGVEYNYKPAVSRFQFVVEEGGGLALFKVMADIFDTYIREKLAGHAENFVVQKWKVFGEQGGLGRSDNCVVLDW